MPRREFGHGILGLFLLVAVSSNAIIIRWSDGGEEAAQRHMDGEAEETLNACNISSINFDGHDLKDAHIQRFAPEMRHDDDDDPGMCVVNVTAPPGVSIVLNILESFDNVKPSYLFVEKFGSCSNTAGCYDR